MRYKKEVRRLKQEGRVKFTKEMKKDYTILLPTMLPMHFTLFSKIFNSYGYKTELLTNTYKSVRDYGLKYVHNDSCYPAILVIGQFIEALESGKYDTDKVAVLITQTGGGCRASNYISLLRKALERAGYGHVPVISFNVSGLEDNPGFKITLPMINRMTYAITYADLLMLLRNQTKPYELIKGNSEKLALQWIDKLAKEMEDSRSIISYRKVKDNYKKIVKDFADLPRSKEKKVKVGIVGEIFVKFSPLGNNNLEEFLISEGVETVMPGLLDFCLYCVYNGMVDTKLYGVRKLKGYFSKYIFNFLVRKQQHVIDVINEEGSFEPPTSFKHTCTLSKGYMGLGAKMGEGWLLTAEMLELIGEGTKNIVCAQPFGCLPNHIVGKGVMKLIKEKNQDVNIVAIDYDPGASAINQENRIKLMLSNAKEPVVVSKPAQEQKEQEKELATV